MRRRWWWLATLLLLGGCEEEVDEVDDPEPVAPVEVTAEDTPPDGTATPEAAPDVAALQARVAELEGQLAACQGGTPTAGTTPTPSGTQVAAVPEGVDTPSQDGEPAGSTASSAGSTASSSSSRRGGGSGASNNDPSGGLLGALLGDGNGNGNGSGNGNGRRRRSGDDDDEGGGSNTLPNPVDVLLGP